MSTPEPTELLALLDAHRDGHLTDEDRTRLTALLAEDPAARALYARVTLMQVCLEMETSGGQESAVGHAVRDKQQVSHAVRDKQPDECSGDPPRDTSPAPRRKSVLNWASRHPQGPAVAIAATVLIAALVAMGLTPVSQWIAGGDKNDATDRQPQDPTASEFVAILNSSQAAKWLDGTEPRLKDPRLQIGRRLAIASGLIEVKYYTGAKVVIEGPAEFVVGGNAVGNAVPGVPERHRGRSLQDDLANSGYLKLGKLVARVEGENAQGFTIETPSARVEDFGTEFGVEVADNGASEVVVLSGEVDVINSEGPEQRVRLTADQGAFVAKSGGTITRRTTVDARLVAAMRSRLTLIREVTSANVATANARSPVYTITDDNTGHQWLVIDNELGEDGDGRVSRLGNWNRSVLGGNAFNHIGFHSQKATTTGTPTAKTAWAFLRLEPGTYEVAVSWAVRPRQAGDAPFSINGGPAILVDQTKISIGPPNLLESHGEDVIGYHVLSTNAKVGVSGTLTVALSNDANGSVVADSVAIRRIAETTTGDAAISKTNQAEKSVKEEPKDTDQPSDVVSGGEEK